MTRAELNKQCNISTRFKKDANGRLVSITKSKPVVKEVPAKSDTQKEPANNQAEPLTMERDIQNEYLAPLNKNKEVKKAVVNEYMESIRAGLKNISDFKSRAIIERVEGSIGEQPVDLNNPDVKTMITQNVYNIASQGYYVAYCNGLVLFQKQVGKGVAFSKALPTVLRKTLDGQSGCGKNIIKQSVDNADKGTWKRSQGDNLTKAEFDSIVSGKPSIEVLLSAYDQYSNDSIGMDISKATPIF
jgi:hypothetical protein